jgi:glyoxylase-like metal-dependent hydrolase (beta-lactamase superfamily II)
MTLDGTNTWVLRAPGEPRCVVVDPGPLLGDHLRSVAAYGPVEAVLVTHGHPDHVDGLERFLELTGAAVIPGGRAAGLTIERIETPGHTADSVSFLVEGSGGQQPAVLTGDTILGRGSTVIAHPDGDLGAYLASLARLQALGPIPALPGHGPVLENVAVAAHGYLRHRLQRLDQVRAALEAGDTTAAEVVARVYADVDRALWPAAEWSVRAQLDYLRRQP